MSARSADSRHAIPAAGHAISARLVSALERLAYLDPARNPFDVIAETLHSGLDCRWAQVARLLPGSDEVELIGAAGGTPLVHGLRYSLRGTPCEHGWSPDDPVVIVREDVAARFPSAGLLGDMNGESYRGAGLFSSAGELLGLVVAIDITPCDDDPGERALLRTAAARATQELERRAAERGRAEQEQRLAAALAISHLGVGEWDVLADRLEVDARLAAMLGLPQPAPVFDHDNWLARVHPEERMRVSAALQYLMTPWAQPLTLEYRMLDDMTGWRWLRVQAQANERAPNGRALRVLGVHADIHERRLAEQALRDKESQLAFAIESAGLAEVTWDIVSGRFEVNPAWPRLLGYAPDEIPPVDRAWAALTHPEDFARARRRVLTLGRRGTLSPPLSYRIRMRDGGWRHVQISGRIVEWDADGQATRAHGLFMDVHAATVRESELATARAQLRDAIEHIDAGILLSSADDRLVLWNQRYADMYGFSPELLRPGTPLVELSRDLHRRYPDYLAGRSIEQAVDERMARHRERRGNWELKLGEHWYRIGDFPTANGGTVSLRTDITAIKQTEQALRESEARLRTVLEYSPIGIFLSAPDGTTVYANRNCLEAAGMEISDLGGTRWHRFLHPDDRQATVAAWAQFCAAADHDFDREYRIRRRDGTDIVLRTRATPIREDGALLGFAGTVEDITRRRADETYRERLQAQLQQAQKMEAIGQLTGGIAHDFNNILASVLGFTMLARRLTVPYANAKLDEYLAAVHQGGERARELIAKMLAFSRHQPGSAQHRASPQALIEEAVRFLKPMMPAGIRISTLIDPKAGDVLVEGVDLHQALVNLAVNARDAIGEFGLITISLRGQQRVTAHCASCNADVDGEFIEIAMRDDGCGIDPALRSRLFEPFFSTKDVGKGSGMGLAVTHGMMHHAQGHIVVESMPGQGTCMRLLLRPAPPLAPAPSPGSEILPQSGAGRRIVVVDDEAPITQMLGALLETEGYRVVAFTDSEAALDWMRTHGDSFDALITDQTMPGMSGLELARRLLALHPDLPVVLCTGYSEVVDPAVCAAAGIAHFLYKPVPPADLLKVLHGALAGPAAP